MRVRVSSLPLFPSAIAIDVDGDVRVTEQMLNRLQKSRADGVHLWTWAGEAEFPLDEPVGIAVTGRGTLLPADYGHGRVLELAQR